MAADRRKAGMTIAYAEPDKIKRQGETSWGVTGSRGVMYLVNIEDWSCSCPDFENRGHSETFRCKHGWAIWYTALLPVSYKAKRLKKGDREVWTVAITKADVILELMGGPMTREAAVAVSETLNGPPVRLDNRSLA